MTNLLSIIQFNHHHHRRRLCRCRRHHHHYVHTNNYSIPQSSAVFHAISLTLFMPNCPPTTSQYKTNAL